MVIRVLVCYLILAGVALGQVPVTGQAVAGLESYDRFMTDFLNKWRIPGGALAVSRNGQLVYARGFGYADRDRQDTVAPDALFRIASVSKPITGVAVMSLVETGKLNLDARVFDLLSNLVPNPAPPNFDGRLREITVRQLLHHTGGWDRDEAGSFDPMFRSVAAAAAVGAPAPASCETVIRYMFGFRLNFAPGQRYAYSNFGFCLLGRIVERVAGQSYEAFVREQILRPMGIERMRIGQTLEAGRVPGEVKYHHWSTNLVSSVFPTGPPQVPAPYGGWYLEAMDSHGGWISSAVDLVRFANYVDGRRGTRLLTAPSVEEMLSRPPAPVSQTGNSWYGKGWSVVRSGNDFNWWHGGSLDGTTSILVRAANGMVWAAVFNLRPQDSDTAFTELDNGLWTAFNAVRNWPPDDLFPSFVNAGSRPRIASTLGVTNGATFQPGVVPGSWITVRGDNLAPVTRQWKSEDFQGDRLPTSLDGVQVLVNGRPSSVYYISPTQLNVQAPQETPTGRVWVQVSRSGDLSEPVPVDIVQNAPGLFTYTAGPKVYAAGIHLDGVYVGDPAVVPGTQTAAAGSRLLLYATGLVPSPAGRTIAAPIPTPNVRVLFGRAEATVEFAGLISPGLFQLNVLLPDDLPAGDAEVLIAIGGVRSRAGVIVPVR
jgi:uncharacterized protein (TIGR03437 family)